MLGGWSRAALTCGARILFDSRGMRGDWLLMLCVSWGCLSRMWRALRAACLVDLLSCLVLWWALVEFLAVVGLVLVLVGASRWRIC